MIVFSAYGWLNVCLHMAMYVYITVADDISNQMKAHTNFLSSKTSPSVVQLRFGNSLAQFVNGTLMMGTEILEFVGEDDVQTREKSFRIVGNKLMIGNETLIPKDGKEVLLASGVTMQPDGSLTSGPEQRGRGDSCTLEGKICGGNFFEDCCKGSRCKGGICQHCGGRNERSGFIKCYTDDECSPCYGAANTNCTEKNNLRYCCLPTGYICESDEHCCGPLICTGDPNQNFRCAEKRTCLERTKCLHDFECCSNQECFNAQCQCKLGQECDDIAKGCCKQERCNKTIGICECQDDAPCNGRYECCITQNCVNNKCKSCVGELGPCTKHDDCCGDVHCYKEKCRNDFVKSIHWFQQEKFDLEKIPLDCLLENTNEGFGGNFIFACPQYTITAFHAPDGFELDRECDPGRDNLWNGTTSKCQHVYPKPNAFGVTRVGEIFWGVKKPEDLTFFDTAGDINKGRGGRDLFLNWRKVYIDPESDIE